MIVVATRKYIFCSFDFSLFCQTANCFESLYKNIRTCVHIYVFTFLFIYLFVCVYIYIYIYIYENMTVRLTLDVSLFCRTTRYVCRIHAWRRELYVVCVCPLSFSMCLSMYLSLSVCVCVTCGKGDSLAASSEEAIDKVYARLRVSEWIWTCEYRVAGSLGALRSLLAYLHMCVCVCVWFIETYWQFFVLLHTFMYYVGSNYTTFTYTYAGIRVDDIHVYVHMYSYAKAMWLALIESNYTTFK